MAKHINQYKTTYYKEQGALIGLIMCFVVFALPGLEDAGKEEYVADKAEAAFMVPIIVVPEPTVEDKIKEYFPRNWKTMIAIAHAESGVSMDAVGYNCYYEGYYGTITTSKGLERVPIITNETALSKKTDGVISVACLKKDRKLAWSVDCFVLQRNYPGRKTCPEGVTLDMHLKESADLSRVQGLGAWVTYNTGAHEKHLAKN